MSVNNSVESLEIPQIDSNRLWSDLMELGKIGRVGETGVTRSALSEDDVAAKRWFMDKLEEAGFEVKIDAACNVIGTLKGTTGSKKSVVVGSHIDTVPAGGMFDGALGVVAGLECARVIKEEGIELPWNLEIINYCDEEGFHNAGTVGSRAMLGMLKEGEIFKAKGAGLPCYADSMANMDKNPAQIAEAVRDISELEYCLEMHIEQGTRLEAENVQIGVVNGIAGMRKYVVTVIGEAGHAGTIPMALRQDALVKAAPLVTLLNQWVQERNPDMVGTIGKMSLEPGAENVVPGKCVMVVEIRSQIEDDLDVIEKKLGDYMAGKPDWSMEKIYQKISIALDEKVVNQVENAARAEGFSNLRMSSGAGHDAASFAPHVPTGMIFVPCRKGISHNPAEWSEPAQVSAGCQVLLRTLLELAAQAD